MRRLPVSLLMALAALSFGPSASALELIFTAPVEVMSPLGGPVPLLTIADGGFGDLDGVVNGEIVFDKAEPSTSGLWSSLLPSADGIVVLRGRVTDSPTGPSFASVLDGVVSPVLTLADFEMTASSASSLTLYMTGDVMVDGAVAGAVDGLLVTPVTPTEIGFLANFGTPTDAVPGWDETFEGMPIRISKGPGDDPAVSGFHGSTLPPIVGIVPVTGILELSLGAGGSIGSVPEPAAGALVMAGLAVLSLRPRQRE